MGSASLSRVALHGKHRAERQQESSRRHRVPVAPVCLLPPQMQQRPQHRSGALPPDDVRSGPGDRGPQRVLGVDLHDMQSCEL